MKNQTLFLSILFCMTLSFNLSAQDDKTWEPPFVGTDTTVLYLPDANAIYWRHGWERKPGDPMGVAINGQFPDARYFSYNIYDDNTKSTLGSFTDYHLKPNDNGVNPFTGASGNSKNTYTIYIVPEGTAFKAANVLFFPDSLTNVSFLLRHYAANGNIYGNVPIPTISQFNGDTKKSSPGAPSVPLPKITQEEIQKYLVPLFKQLGEEYESNPEEVMAKIHNHDQSNSLKINELICRQVVAGAFTHFKKSGTNQSYRLNAGGTYPNNDNLYLTMPIIRENDDVLLVKFKTPKYPKSNKEYPNSNLRYFSLSQGDDITYNYATTMDKDMIVSEDGFSYFIIGNDETAIRDKAKSLGVNYMPWLVHDKMLLIYRHMLPKADFKYGINQVPIYDNNKAENGQEASAFIGEYAPIGILIPKAQLLAANSFPKF